MAFLASTDWRRKPSVTTEPTRKGLAALPSTAISAAPCFRPAATPTSENRLAAAGAAATPSGALELAPRNLASAAASVGGGAERDGGGACALTPRALILSPQ